MTDAAIAWAGRLAPDLDTYRALLAIDLFERWPLETRPSEAARVV